MKKTQEQALSEIEAVIADRYALVKYIDCKNVLIADKYDPYVKRYIALEDYIKECYRGLPNESMLEEQWNALPDHPSSVTMTFTELYGAFRGIEALTRQGILNSVAEMRDKWRDTRASEDDLMLISEEILNL